MIRDQHTTIALINLARAYASSWSDNPDTYRMEATNDEIGDAFSLLTDMADRLEELSKPAPENPRYQYKYTPFPCTNQDFKDASDLGWSGWELMEVFTAGTQYYAQHTIKYRRQEKDWK